MSKGHTGVAGLHEIDNDMGSFSASVTLTVYKISPKLTAVTVMFMVSVRKENMTLENLSKAKSISGPNCYFCR